MNERIDDKYLTASHRPGEIILSEDMNELESVVKEAINANYEDIQKIENGTIMVGNASQLQGATLSTYESSELTDEDNKFPSSRQVKRYIDASDTTLQGNIDTLNTTLRGVIAEEKADVKSYVDANAGATLDLDINGSTYVVTATLKNSAGTVLSSDTIDLPIESMVVSAEYDAENKEIILTLQSGSTVSFSVADLVSGLQTEITSSNKLDSDLVDDTNQTNKFITTGGLNKLSGIETGAQVNVIESITVNGTQITITNKNASIAVQETLVSGVNIKTVNNQSLLGSGNLVISGSGGDDYDQLQNRPSINNVTLTGNKTTSDLGIVIPTKVSDLTNDSGFITSYTETDPTVPSHVKSITSSNISSWNGKEDSSNKEQSITTSTTNYPSSNAVKGYVDSYKTTGETVLLSTSGWQLNTNTDLYEYTVTKTGLTTDYRVDIYMDITNQERLSGSAYTETFSGSYKIYTDELPTEAISCTAYFTKVNN